MINQFAEHKEIERAFSNVAKVIVLRHWGRETSVKQGEIKADI